MRLPLLGLLAWAAMPAQAGVIAARPLEPGTIVAAADVADGPPHRAGLSADAAIGREAVRRIAAGRMLTAYDLRAPRAVRRGEPVTLVYRRGGLEITGPGRALGDAAAGASLRAAAGSRTVEGIALADGRVLVED